MNVITMLLLLVVSTSLLAADRAVTQELGEDTIAARKETT
jgi:hypothetical protein